MLDRQGKAYELLFIDDGSTDRSPDVLQALAEQDERVRIVTLRTNLGKAMALAAGFRRARGDVIVTLDADLQDDPEEIPRFLKELEGGSDLVSGWRKARHDPRPKVDPVPDLQLGHADGHRESRSTISTAGSRPIAGIS